MSKREIQVPPELISELDESFQQGPMLTESGLRDLNEEQVARLNKCRSRFGRTNIPRRTST